MDRISLRSLARSDAASETAAVATVQEAEKKLTPASVRGLEKLTKRDILRIAETPPKFLSRKEALVKRLVDKFHDDNTRLDRQMDAAEASTALEARDGDGSDGSSARGGESSGSEEEEAQYGLADAEAAKVQAERRRRARAARLAARNKRHAQLFDADLAARVRATPEVWRPPTLPRTHAQTHTRGLGP